MTDPNQALQDHLGRLRARQDWTPLNIISLLGNENKMPPLMLLCRAPADDGWLAVEAKTGIIYNVFDSVARLYEEWDCKQPNHPDLKSRVKQAELLSRARWFHQPVGMATVGIPKRIRELAR